MKRVRGNKMDFSTIDITSKEVRGNNIDFSAIIEITSKIVRESNEDFLTREIVSAKVPGNNVDIFIRQNMSKKTRANRVNFSTIEITWTKHPEMTRKFVEIYSSTYRRNIHDQSTWIRLGVLVGLLERI